MLGSVALLLVASAPDLFGYGARGLATASTLTATAAGGEAVYYNPANLAFSKRASFGVGFQWADFYLRIDGRDEDASAAPATTITFDVPLPFKGTLAERLTLGFGFVLPVGSILTADIPRPGTPRFVRLDHRAETVSLMGALGVRVLDELAIGGGFIALSELEGDIAVAPNESGRIGTQVKDQLVADFAAVLGATYRLDGWAFSVVFRDESTASFELPIRADLGDQFPLPIPDLAISGTAQFDPRQLIGAASGRIFSSWVGSLSIGWENWSRYRNPIVYTAVPEGFPAQPEPGFRDTVTLRVGAEYSLEYDEFSIIPRAGFGISPSPVPEQTGLHNYLDSTRLIFAGGGGLRYGGLRIDAGIQAQYLPDRVETKDASITVPEDLAGRARTVRHSGVVLATAIEVGVEL